MSHTDSPALPEVAAAAWSRLSEGNARYAAGRSDHPHLDEARRGEVAGGQRPFAVVLGCMDSRVPVELVFDQGLGDLAVVRTAGHVVDGGALGSVEYGVTALGAGLVVVLGHSACGAVKATLAAQGSGQMPAGFIRDVVEHVSASLVRVVSGARPVHEVTPEELTDEHVRRTVARILQRSDLIRQRVEAGECAVVGARYDLTDGIVKLVPAAADQG